MRGVVKTEGRRGSCFESISSFNYLCLYRCLPLSFIQVFMSYFIYMITTTTIISNIPSSSLTRVVGPSGYGVPYDETMRRPVRIMLRYLAQNMTQNGPNFSNLVNIEIVNSRENTLTATTKEHVPKPPSDMQRSKLRIAHLNVRSIKNRNHLIQVRELMKDRNYDILALSELWLNSTVTNAEVEIEGFKLTSLDRLGKTGRGVGVYSKSCIKVKCLKNITWISEFGFHQL